MFAKLRRRFRNERKTTRREKISKDVMFNESVSFEYILPIPIPQKLPILADID